MSIFDLDRTGKMTWTFNSIEIRKIDLGFTLRKYRLKINGTFNQPTHAMNTSYEAICSWDFGKFHEIIEVNNPFLSREETATIEGDAPYDPWLVESPSVSNVSANFDPNDTGVLWFVKNGPMPWSSQFLSKDKKDALLSDLQMIFPEIILPDHDNTLPGKNASLKVKIKHFPANGLTWIIEHKPLLSTWSEEKTRTYNVGKNSWSSDTCTVSKIKEKWFEATYIMEFHDNGDYRFKVRSNFQTPSSAWSDWQYVKIQVVVAAPNR